MIFANYCEENGMEDDAVSYNNLATYLLAVLQEAKVENENKQVIKLVKPNQKEQ